MNTAFQLDDFLSYFGEFSDSSKYPTNRLIGYGNRAMFHITRAVPDMPLEGPSRGYALFLMTAHLIALDDPDGLGLVDENGKPVNRTGGMSLSGQTFKTSIGSVSIENTKPNTFTSDEFEYWLNQTKYGRELLVLLATSSTPGVFINTPVDSVRDLI